MTFVMIKVILYSRFMPSVDNDFGEVLLKYFFSANIDFVVTIMAKNVHLCRIAAAAKNYLLSWTAIYV